MFEADRRLAERARLALPAGVTIVEDPAALGHAAFDAVLASDVLHRASRDLLSPLASSLAAGGLFAAVEPGASLFRDMVFGLDAGWFEADGDVPVGRLDDVAGWQRSLSAVGLVKVAADRAVTRNGNDLLLLAEAPAAAEGGRRPDLRLRHRLEDEFAAETASSLATLLVASGVHVSIILDSEASLRELERETPDTVVYLAGAFNRGGEPAERLRERCLGLKRCVEHLGTRRPGSGSSAPAPPATAAGSPAASRPASGPSPGRSPTRWPPSTCAASTSRRRSPRSAPRSACAT